jgi:hypothetical protein
MFAIRESTVGDIVVFDVGILIGVMASERMRITFK